MIKTKCIDLSKWNGDVDFEKVKADGISKVILRSSFRHTVDTKFVENVQKAKAAGVEIAGIYHFSYALNTAQASSEAKFCLELLDQVQLPDTMAFFDLEYDSIIKASQSGVSLLPVDVNAHAKAFCEYVEKRGRRVGLYMNIDFYQNYYDQDLKNRYPIWLADYSGDPDYTCLVHQYTNRGRVDGISGNVDMDYWYESQVEDYVVFTQPDRSAQQVVNLATSWLGKNEADGSFKEIIDIYNRFSPLPRNVKMQYDWAWCACTWSAIAIALGYTDIMPIEISCGFLIDKAKEMGIWVENDGTTPKQGWGILYDWQDNGKGDNVGWPDHIGVVTYANEEKGQMLVIEGNYSNAVKERVMPIDGVYIRGFIAPNYSEEFVNKPVVTNKSVEEIADEVIAGLWGNGEDRKSRLLLSGYDPAEIQKVVNQRLASPNELAGVTGTPADPKAPYSMHYKASCYARNFGKDLAGIYSATANLNLRDGAGTSHRALVTLPKGSQVRCYGYYTQKDKVRWMYVETVFNKKKYTGFCCSSYLKKK